MSKCNSLFQDQQEQMALREFAEYQAHGGQMDFTDWCAEQEMKADEARLEMDIFRPDGDEHCV